MIPTPTRHLATAALVAVAAAVPALAGPPVDPHLVTMQPGTDGVVIEGYALGVPATVQVFRGGGLVATAPVVPASDPHGTLAQVNNLAGGACWQGITPDITFGDVIRVTQNGVSEDAAVQNLTVAAPQDVDPTTVKVTGLASSATGARLAVSGIGVQIQNTGFTGGRPFRRLPGDSGTIAFDALPPATTNWTATFTQLNDPIDHAAALAPSATVATWTSALGTEVTEVEPGPTTGGPLGTCTAPATVNAATSAAPAEYRFDSTNLTIFGIAEPTATSVTATVADVLTSSPDVVAGPVTPFSTGGGKAWSVTLPASAVQGLADGPLTITPRMQVGAVTTLGAALTVTKNTVPPDTTPPTVTIGGGPNAITRSTVAVFDLRASEPATFQCMLDAVAVAPCDNSLILAKLREGAHTFTAHATDRAGNVGPDVTRTWRVDLTPPRLRATIPAAQRATFERSGPLLVNARCNERCVIRIRVIGRSLAATSRLFTLRANTSGRARLVLTAAQHRALRRVRDGGGTVTVSVTATDRAGNRATKAITLT